MNYLLDIETVINPNAVAQHNFEVIDEFLNRAEGGHVVDLSVSSSETIVVPDVAASYAFRADSGTTDADVSTTFNVTAHPNALGRQIIVHLRAEKGSTAGARSSQVALQINGATVAMAVGTASGTDPDVEDASFQLTWNPWAAKWSWIELTIGP